MSFYHPAVEYTTEISAEDVPEGDTLKAMLAKFSKHAYHLGAWPENESPDELPIDKTSHVVRKVGLNDQGGLDVKFNFITTPRGFELMKTYDEENFKFVTVIDDTDGFTVRIDVIGTKK